MNTKVMKIRKARIRRFDIKSILIISMIVISIIAFTNWLEDDISVNYIRDYTTYIVSDGDRLWNIAESVSAGKDVREVVYIIKKDNNLDNANLYIGQELKIRNEY